MSIDPEKVSAADRRVASGSVPGNRWVSSSRAAPASVAYRPACRALLRYRALSSGTRSG
jgi:hypothetical protein